METSDQAAGRLPGCCGNWLLHINDVLDTGLSLRESQVGGEKKTEGKQMRSGVHESIHEKGPLSHRDDAGMLCFYHMEELV